MNDTQQYRYYRQYKGDATVHEISKAIALEKLGDAYRNPVEVLACATKDNPAQTNFGYYWIEEQLKP